MPAPPTDWADVRDRRQLANAVRTVAAVLAFAVLALPRDGISLRGGRR